MKKLLPLMILLSLVGISTLSQAENLLQVYKQAQLSNPDLRKEFAERDAVFEKINQARSSLLPQLGLDAGYSYSRGFRDNSNSNSHVTSGNVVLKQTIFNMSQWRNLTLEEKQENIQNIIFQANEQKLILDTATSYFDVLHAIDKLSYTEAQKKAIYRQSNQKTQRFNVGLFAIIDVQTAQANYDEVLAREVDACNKLDNALESLRQVTGIYYPELASLNLKRLKKNTPRRLIIY